MKKSSTTSTNAADAADFSPGAKACFERIDWNAPTGAAHIAGFNYQPSWAESGERCWLTDFDAVLYRHELANGKTLFPRMNIVRIWLHYGAWRKDPAAFLANLKQALAICRELDLLVIPVMTSLWGRKSGWGLGITGQDDPAVLPDMERYFLAVNEASEGSANILVWDICNEPWNTDAWVPWLQGLCDLVHEYFAAPRTTVGYAYLSNFGELPLLSYVDLWSPHLYRPFLHNATVPESAAALKRDLPRLKVEYKEGVRAWLEEAYLPHPHGNRPAIVNECCWGSLDDAVRAEIVDGTLSALVDLGLGFAAHALQESLAQDLHRPAHGRVGAPGYMGFVQMDGTLRPGHDVFNTRAERASCF